jgi:hypothetical protein
VKPTVSVIEQRQVTTTRRIALDAEQVRALLRASGVDVPANARVSFEVPCGGDWSGYMLDVDKDHPIHVTWTTSEHASSVATE